MGLVIENTHGWDNERFLKVLPSVRALIQRLVSEFPHELSEDFLLGEAMAGKKHLWVVYDEAEPDRAVIVGFTEIRTNTATGRKYVEYNALCGDRLREVLDDIVEKFEAWGRERDAQEAMIVGRFGWIPMLKEHGYKKTAVILKRQLGDEANVA